MRWPWQRRAGESLPPMRSMKDITAEVGMLLYFEYRNTAPKRLVYPEAPEPGMSEVPLPFYFCVHCGRAHERLCFCRCDHNTGNSVLYVDAELLRAIAKLQPKPAYFIG